MLILLATAQAHGCQALQKRQPLLLRVLVVSYLATLGANFVLRRHRVVHQFAACAKRAAGSVPAAAE